MYSQVPGPNGTIRYKKDARFVKKVDIPADILIKLEVGATEVNEKPPVIDNKCIFCGQETKQFKLLNSQAIPICANDYYDKTTGQVAQQLREREEHDIQAQGRIIQSKDPSPAEVAEQ